MPASLASSLNDFTVNLRYVLVSCIGTTRYMGTGKPLRESKSPRLLSNVVQLQTIHHNSAGRYVPMRVRMYEIRSWPTTWSCLELWRLTWGNSFRVCRIGRHVESLLLCMPTVEHRKRSLGHIAHSIHILVAVHFRDSSTYSVLTAYCYSRS